MYLYIYRSEAKIVYDPDTTNDDSWELPPSPLLVFMYAIN